MVLPALAVIAAGLTATWLAPEVASKVQELKEKEEYQRFRQDPRFLPSFRTGATAVDAAYPNDLLYQVSGFIPGIGALDRRRQEQFVYATQADLMQRGLNRKKALDYANAAYRDYAARAISEVPTALAGEVGAETVGRKILQRELPKAITYAESRRIFNPVARAGIKASGVAGVYEGSQQVLAQDLSTRQFGSEGKRKQLERVALGAGAGAAIAGSFGLVIAGQRIARRPLSKGAEVLGYSIDPGELPGDVIADRVAKRYREPPLPRVTVFGGPEIRPKVKRAGGFANAITTMMGAPAQSLEISESAQKSLNDIEEARARQFAPNQSRSQSDNRGRPGGGSSSRDLIPNIGDTPNNIPPRNPNPTNSQQNQESQQSQESFANVPNDVGIPSSATIYRGGAPPLPMLPPGDDDGRGGGGPRSQRFVNEVRRGSRLFRRLI